MSRRRLAGIVALSVALAGLPPATDFLFGHRLVDAARILGRPTIPPAELIGFFQVVELVLVIAYLSAIRRHPLRLVLALGVLAAAGIGFLGHASFRALRPHSFYGPLTAPMEWIAASATLLGVACAALGTLLVRKPRSAYVPPTALLVGSAAGILFAPLLAPDDPRLFALEIGRFASRRFSASELGWLLAAGWSSWLYSKDRSAAWIERSFRPAARRLLKQLAAADGYTSRVRVSGVEVVDRSWEQSLVGSGLDVHREGRRYVGVPSPAATRWRLRRLARRMGWLRIAAAVAIATGVAALLVRTLAA